MSLDIPVLAGVPRRPAPLDPDRLAAFRRQVQADSEPVTLLGLEAAYDPGSDQATLQAWLGTSAPGIQFTQVYLALYVSATQVPLELAYGGLQQTDATLDAAIYTAFLLTSRLADEYGGQTLGVAVFGEYLQDGATGQFGPFKTTLAISGP